MKLTTVGCSGSFAGPDAAASCHLVEHDGFRVVLDLGNGAAGPLQRHLSLDQLDAVAISHLHLDHVVDLWAVYVARRYHPVGTPPPLRVIAPSDARERLAAMFGASLEIFDSVFAFESVSARTSLGPMTLSSVLVNHPVEAYGLRLDVDGRSLTYSGDTGPCQELARLAADCDVLLSEASFVDGEGNPEGLHLTGSQAGELATEARVGELLITHVPPWNSREQAVAEAATRYDGPIRAVVPGLTVHVGATGA